MDGEIELLKQEIERLEAELKKAKPRPRRWMKLRWTIFLVFLLAVGVAFFSAILGKGSHFSYSNNGRIGPRFFGGHDKVGVLSIKPIDEQGDGSLAWEFSTDIPWLADGNKPAPWRYVWR
jgi:hypothetical protein